MSDSVPPPPPPPPGGQPPVQPPAGGQPPDLAYFGPEGGGNVPPPEPGASGASRGLKVGIIAASLTLIIGGGAVAFYAADPFHLFRPGAQAAEAVPADAIFYAGMDIDPTAKQKINAIRFLNHFPAFKDQANVDEDTDIRKVLGEKFIDDAPCGDDVSYADDLEPWLGTKLGVAVMPSADGADAFDDSSVIGVVETTDQSKAKDGLAALKKCADVGEDGGFGYAFVGDFAVIATTQEAASDYASDASDHSLADDADFKSDMDSLGEQGVASMWVDVKAALDNIPTDEVPDLTSNQFDLLESSVSRFAATFRFGSNTAEIASSAFTTTSAVDVPSNQVTKLPDSTVFALSVAGGGQQLAASWDEIKSAMSEQGVDVDSQLSEFEDSTGLTLPDDLETVFGDNMMLSLDSEGLTFDNLRAAQFDQINAGVRFTSDPAALGDIYDKVVTLVEQQIGRPIDIDKVDTDDGMVLATNKSYADKLAEDGSLGNSSDFTSVIDDAADQQVVVYLDWNAIQDQIDEAIDAGGEGADAKANLDVLRAFGISAGRDGDYVKSVFKVSLDD